MILASDWTGWGEAVVKVGLIAWGGGSLVLGALTILIMALIRRQAATLWFLPFAILLWIVLIPIGFLAYLQFFAG